MKYGVLHTVTTIGDNMKIRMPIRIDVVIAWHILLLLRTYHISKSGGILIIISIWMVLHASDSWLFLLVVLDGVDVAVTSPSKEVAMGHCE